MQLLLCDNFYCTLLLSLEPFTLHLLRIHILVWLIKDTIPHGAIIEPARDIDSAKHIWDSMMGWGTSLMLII